MANKQIEKQILCPNCGAPVTSEICQYCGTMTGLDTASANMEYPLIECKEAHLNFWNLAFPAIFAFGFGFFGFIFPIAFSMAGDKFGGFAKIICIPFAVIGVVALIIVLRNLYYYFSVRLMGKETEGTVYGYVDDDMVLNGQAAQACKILIHTSEGPRFIMYQLKETLRPYGINGKIRLKVYKDRFTIVK
ncbi:MAG: hypothetical protein K6F84_05315 [Lachnospiraceae bacterium]|nr:hypothetical protein [Lachnospiraceae bacterium]